MIVGGPSVSAVALVLSTLNLVFNTWEVPVANETTTSSPILRGSHIAESLRSEFSGIPRLRLLRGLNSLHCYDRMAEEARVDNDNQILVAIEKA